MPNLITHKANRANGIFTVAGNAGNSSASVVLYQDFFFGNVNKVLSFLNGATEPTVGDNVIVNSVVIGKLEAYSLNGGAWDGSGTGTLTLSNMTVEASFSDTWTTSSGGAGQCGATEVELCETSITDSSVSDFAIDDISDNGDRVKVKSGAIETPNNAINWTEADSTEIYESLFLVVCKSDLAWSVTLGDASGSAGYIVIDSSTQGGKVLGADNLITLAGADAFVTDGTVHTYAVLLKGGLSPSYSFEVDGIETASNLGTNAGLIDMSIENKINYSGCTPLGILACRFKGGIPPDYRLAVEEMKTAWENGDIGISSRFIGV